MKIFRKTGVAVLLTVLMIAAAIGIGRWRGAQAEAVPPPSSELDTSLSAGTYLNWISDGADVLSDAQENQIALYNANWVERYDSLIAVATVSSLSEDIGDYADRAGLRRRHPGGECGKRGLLSGGGAGLPHDGQPGVLLSGPLSL